MDRYQRSYHQNHQFVSAFAQTAGIMSSTISWVNLTHSSFGNNSKSFVDLLKFCDIQENSTDLINLPLCDEQDSLTPVKTLGIALAICVVLIMFTMGCKVNLKNIRDRIVRPWGVLIGFLCQFGIMPLCAFALAKLFKLSQGKALVVLIVGCLPGGSASNLMTYLSKGDLDFGITMTTLSTILSFAMMPLCLFVYGSFFQFESISMPYVTICTMLIAAIIPLVVGMVVNCYKPDIARKLTKFGAIIATLAIVGCSVSGLILYPEAFKIPPDLWIISFIMPLFGYICGYVISFAVGKTLKRSGITQKQMRTIAIETGLQNVQLCTAIVQLNYGCTCFILETFAFPMMFFLFQILQSVTISGTVQIYYRFIRKMAPEDSEVTGGEGTTGDPDQVGSKLLTPLDDAVSPITDKNLKQQSHI